MENPRRPYLSRDRHLCYIRHAFMVFGMLLYDLTLPAYIGSTLLSLLISILAFSRLPYF